MKSRESDPPDRRRSSPLRIALMLLVGAAAIFIYLRGEYGPRLVGVRVPDVGTKRFGETKWMYYWVPLQLDDGVFRVARLGPRANGPGFIRGGPWPVVLSPRSEFAAVVFEWTDAQVFALEDARIHRFQGREILNTNRHLYIPKFKALRALTPDEQVLARSAIEKDIAAHGNGKYEVRFNLLPPRN